ncbi:MAG: tetratricopeptide repeat protein [Gemmataceae bacterium]
MSVHPLTCRDCNQECVLDRVGPFPPNGDQRSYAVAWICPQCSRKSLDVCPLGPLVPAASRCLNCGTNYPDECSDPVCPDCSLPRSRVLATLGVESIPPDPLAAARDAFRRGLIRRGLALLNFALQRDAGLADAWSLKCSFLDSLGYTRAKSAMLEGALAVGGPASLWISYGYTLEAMERHADAIAAYRRYLELLPAGPGAAVACGNQANSLARLGDRPAAEQFYLQALALEPERLRHARNYVRFLIDAQRWEETLAVLNAALERATTDADLIALLEDRALVLAEQEKGAESLESIEAALARGSDSLRTHYLHGRALAQLGRLDEAREKILHVLTLDPENADGKRALEMIDSVLVWGRLPKG